MPRSKPDTISRFVHLYKGVEEFYFLNRDGELGYIKSGEPRSVKETFPQLKDRAFVSANPHFIRELEAFLRGLGEISAAYRAEPPYDLELGYVLPASEKRPWRSSTLVLHKHVVEALKADHEVMVSTGTKNPADAERDLSRIEGVRSIHEGLDELTYHRDTFGEYRYFPALFVLPEQLETQDLHGSRSNVRVINLRWRGKGSEPFASRSAVNGTRELVFSLLRENLMQRGAIDRSQRLEPRFSVA